MFHHATTVITILAITACSPSETSDDPPIGSDAAGDAVVDVTADTGPETPAGPSTLDFAVTAAGPYNVGYRTMEWTYDPAGVDGSRTITVHAWYPTEATEGENPRYGGLFPDEDAFVDVPAAAPVDGESYPVLVHSHGHQAYAGNSSSLMRYMASHGWVAVAPDHVGDMLVDASDSETVAHYLKRPQDISQALDVVTQMPELAAADTSRVVLSGHSRGVYTVWANAGATYDTARIAAERPDATTTELDAFATGFMDGRVVAALPMAGSYRDAWFGDAGYTSVDVPVLVLTGSEDNPQNAQSQWETIEGLDFTWVEIAQACHQAFALGTCDNLGMEEGFSIVNTYGLAFARHHVLGDATMAPILDGSQSVSAKATLQAK